MLEILKNVLSAGTPLWAWVRIIILLGACFSAWAGLVARVSAMEERATAMRDANTQFQNLFLHEFRAVQHTVGSIQLDMAMLCAKTFSPEECWTSKRGEQIRDE